MPFSTSYLQLALAYARDSRVKNDRVVLPSRRCKRILSYYNMLIRANVYFIFEKKAHINEKSFTTYQIT